MRSYDEAEQRDGDEPNQMMSKLSEAERHCHDRTIRRVQDQLWRLLMQYILMLYVNEAGWPN